MFKHILLAATLAVTPAAFAQDHGHHDDHAHQHDEHDHASHDHAEATHSDHGDHTTGPARLSHTAEIDAAIAAGGTPVVVEVLGAVCDFCAKAMNKSFGRRDDVAAVYVDLDEKTLNLVLAPGASMDDDEIRKVVKKSGYKAKDIFREGLSGS